MDRNLNVTSLLPVGFLALFGYACFCQGFDGGMRLQALPDASVDLDNTTAQPSRVTPGAAPS